MSKIFLIVERFLNGIVPNPHDLRKLKRDDPDDHAADRSLEIIPESSKSPIGLRSCTASS